MVGPASLARLGKTDGYNDWPPHYFSSVEQQILISLSDGNAAGCHKPSSQAESIIVTIIIMQANMGASLRGFGRPRSLSPDFRIFKCLICIHTERVTSLQDPSSDKHVDTSAWGIILTLHDKNNTGGTVSPLHGPEWGGGHSGGGAQLLCPRATALPCL